MTDQRRSLVKAALSHDGHFTAVDIHERMRALRDPVSLATIYRALSLLEEAGILEGHDFADGLRRYERSLTREHHDHVICLDCRAVVEFHDAGIEALQEKVLSQHGFDMVHHTMTMFASCRTLKDTGSCPRRLAERGGRPEGRGRAEA